jgi:predicted acetyltransferase
MSLTFHRAQPADWEEMNHVWAWVYEGSPPNEALDPEPEGITRVLVREDGKAAAVCSIIDYEIARGESTLSCGGIGGVATLVESRRSGAGSALMRGTLRQMFDDGKAISALYAFKEEYYRRFGWEACGWRWQHSLPSHRIPETELSLPVRQIKPEDAAGLDSAYVPMIRALSGSHLRSSDDWQKRLGKKPMAIYAVGDPIEGYFWAKAVEFWETAEIGEIAWSTSRGYDSLWAVIKGLCSNQANVTWCEPPNGPIIGRFVNQGLDSKLSRPTMFRVINVEKALKAIAPAGGEFSFCLEVVDEEIPENCGAFKVTSGPGSSTVIRGGEPDFKLDVRQLSQAVMGDPSLKQISEWGLLETFDEAGLDQAIEWFGSMPVVCMEFF